MMHDQQQAVEAHNTNEDFTRKKMQSMSQSLNRSMIDHSKPVQGRRKIHIGAQMMNSQYEFESNFIKTSKYTMVNFIPKCLLLQFKRYANIYFLVIALLQSIKAISPLNPVSAWAPLIFVIGLSMAREGYEDYQRYKSDIEVNSSTTKVYRNTKPIDCKWGDLLVGDICLIKENETFPADLIVINSSSEGGICFIETSSLDGEKNYKNKEAVTSTLKWVQPDKQAVIRLMGTVNCIEPNENLHQFEGTISYSGEIVIVGAKQFLLRGAKLRNTKWIVGIVVYTGEDTKIMKNADKSKYKVSNIERETNSYILVIFFFQILISIGSSIGNTIWNINRNPSYVFIPDPDNTFQEGFLTFLSYLVLNNTMIPISLIVSLELVKMVQGFIIAADEELRQIEDGTLKFPKVFTTSINEELGQVQYIFSDKTGTLTCNKMELKLICIGKELYGDALMIREMQKHLTTTQQPDEGLTLADMDIEPIISKRDNALVKVFEGINNELLANPIDLMDSKTNSRVLYSIQTLRDLAHDYFMLLATCHECVIEQTEKTNLVEEPVSKPSTPILPQNDNNNNNNTNQNKNLLSLNSYRQNGIESARLNLQSPFPSSSNTSFHNLGGQQQNSNSNIDIKYQGPSPDEITLVDTAKNYGYVYLGGTSSMINLEVQGEKVSLELLKQFEFNSDRKRMSIIVRHQGLIKMYIKGADNMILARLNSKIEQPYLNDTKLKINAFSKQGLRTLLVAMRIIEETDYKALQKRYQSAGNAKNREELFFQIAEDYEKDLYLLGATAVEDKLQDQVPETIRDLLLAKINVWMLTGDKMETAENIAKSCKLIQPNFEILRYSIIRPVLLEGQVYETPGSDIVAELKRIQGISDALLANNKSKAFLIEGQDLGDVLSQPSYQSQLIEIVKHCESVVCCRATPKQKAQVVRLVKERLGKITLAIGDGANDVNMIQEAHIGIGLYGQEGMRAVQASDYALPEFKGLWRLLLVHGRWNYIRISEMILYFFYKNFVFTIPQFYFSFWNGFSAQSIFDDYYITLFNILFTAFPLIIRAVTEQDMYYKVIEKTPDNQEKLVSNEKLLRLYPKAYYLGQQNTIFNSRNFISWLLQGLAHASIIFIVHSISISNNAMNSDGMSPDLWVYSICIYSSIILVVDAKLAINAKYWTKILLLSILITSMGMYFLYIFVANLIESFKVYATAKIIFQMPNFYLIIFFCVFLVLSFEVLILYLKEVDYKGFIEHLRALLHRKKDLENSVYLRQLEQVDTYKDQGRHVPEIVSHTNNHNKNLNQNNNQPSPKKLQDPLH